MRVGGFKRNKDMRDKLSPDGSRGSPAGSRMSKTMNKTLREDFMRSLSKRGQGPGEPEMISEPVKIKEWRKKETQKDGISNLQLNLYRAVIEKKEQKEAAIRAALAKRRGEREREQAKMNPWKFDAAERKAILNINSSQDSFSMKYTTNEKDKSHVIQEGKFLKI